MDSAPKGVRLWESPQRGHPPKWLVSFLVFHNMCSIPVRTQAFRCWVRTQTRRVSRALLCVCVRAFVRVPCFFEGNQKDATNLLSSRLLTHTSRLCQVVLESSCCFLTKHVFQRFWPFCWCPLVFVLNPCCLCFADHRKIAGAA